MKLKLWVKALLILLLIAGTTSIIYFCFINNNIKNSPINTNNEQNYITLEKIKKTDYYNKKYDNEYKKINYKDNDNFFKYISILLDKKYTAKEINNIMQMSNNNIDKLLVSDYIDVEKYYKIKNFDVNKYNRYESYAKNNDYPIQDIVTYVNINLDLKPYKETIQVSVPEDLLALVNKYNGLPTNYKPSDLEYVDGFYGNKVPMRKIAKENFIKLQEKAKQDGINIMPTTAYRDANFQSTLYNNYVAKDGIDAADKYSARPGYSDHQTGLAVDLKDANIKTDIRLSDDDYKWLKNNCANFGFIIRYPENKKNITLYQFENWHIRFVGNDDAKIIMENDLTLEEYIDLYINDY